MKVLYLALAGGSIDHDDHKNSQIATWAHNGNPDSRVIWMQGDPTLKSPKLEGNNLYLPLEEHYENLLHKTILAVNWVLENIEFDFLIRTNTSNYFHDPLVRKYLGKYSSDQNISGGVIAKWRGSIKGQKNSYEYISGAGIFLSKKSSEILSNLNAFDYAEVPDDVAIGHWLGSNKTIFVGIPRNNITDFKIIWPTPQTRVKSWVYPKTTVLRMREVHTIYSAQSKEELVYLVKNFIDSERKRCRAENKKRRGSIFSIQSACLRYLITRKFESSLNIK